MEDYLLRKFEQILLRVERVEKEDLDLVSISSSNHGMVAIETKGLSSHVAKPPGRKQEPVLEARFLEHGERVCMSQAIAIGI